MPFTLNSESNLNVISIEDTILKNAQMSDVVDCVRALIQQGRTNFIMDMQKVKSMNNCALGMMLTCLLQSREMGGDFILASVSEEVFRFLEEAKLKSKFIIATSVEEGKAILKTHLLQS